MFHFGFSYVGILYLLMLFFLIFSGQNICLKDMRTAQRKKTKYCLHLKESVRYLPVWLYWSFLTSFVFLGIYGSNVFLLVSVIILGIGHIEIHLQHRLFPWKKPICIVTGMHIQRHKQTEKIHQNLKTHINNMKAIRILLILWIFETRAINIIR